MIFYCQSNINEVDNHKLKSKKRNRLAIDAISVGTPVSHGGFRSKIKHFNIGQQNNWFSDVLPVLLHDSGGIWKN